jgi:hypothetical protein
MFFTNFTFLRVDHKKSKKIKFSCKNIFQKTFSKQYNDLIFIPCCENCTENFNVNSFKYVMFICQRIFDAEQSQFRFFFLQDICIFIELKKSCRARGSIRLCETHAAMAATDHCRTPLFSPLAI